MEKVYYLNTDLDLLSSKDLAPIAQAFESEAYCLYCGEAGQGHFRASFEMKELVNSPDVVMQHFCFLAESLEGEARALWDGCFKKVFDIGYEGGVDHASYTDELRVETLKQVAELGACIRVTVYPMEK
ncbi:MAG: hypothetical protein D3913_01295 [Candidatus Electrothrix sp. LOE1_4_5]|nr:hypothetical protein [Candidatus Electrothrix gigas]